MTDEPKGQAEKKIIIDEDWKSRVEAEKELSQPPETAKPFRRGTGAARFCPFGR